jgi:hypothetical protein
MSWIGKPITQWRPPVLKAVPTTSLEYATVVSVRGIAPANAIVEYLTAAQCRLRTIVFFEVGECVEFPFGLPKAKKILVRGDVISRTANGPRFIYRLHLDGANAEDVDDAVQEVAAFQRHSAATESREDPLVRLRTTEQLTRSSVRVPATFPIEYRTPNQGTRPAKAGDLSIDGMSMTCREALVQGEPVEVRITLPSDVLAVYPEETAAIDLHKGTATALRNGQHRPFEERTLGGRIVNHRPLADGTFTYGLAFTCIDRQQSEELARYIDAVQRAQR